MNPRNVAGFSAGINKPKDNHDVDISSVVGEVKRNQVWTLTISEYENKIDVLNFTVSWKPRQGLCFVALDDFTVTYIGLNAKIIISGEHVGEYDPEAKEINYL